MVGEHHLACDREAEAGAGLARARGRPRRARSARTGCSWSPSGSPGPWSRTLTARFVAVARSPTPRSVCPAGVCTSALRIRLASTWLQLVGVARTRSPPRRARRSIARSGAVARASLTASPASRRRRRAHAAAPGSSSRRASVRRSSTSTPMRLDSSSIRRIASSVPPRSLGCAHAEQLGVAADRGERRAQLVRGVGEELAQALFALLALGERLLEPVEHRVQREAEATDLGLRRRGARRGARARRAAISPGGDLDAVERAQAEAHDEERARRRGRASTPAITSPSTSSRRLSVCSTSCSGTATSVSPRSSGSWLAIGAVAAGRELPTEPTVNSFPIGDVRRKLGRAASICAVVMNDVAEDVAGRIAALAVGARRQVRPAARAAGRAPPPPRSPLRVPAAGARPGACVAFTVRGRSRARRERRGRRRGPPGRRGPAGRSAARRR